MALTDSLTLDHDMTSDFIVIQSCLRDEQHSEFVQSCKYVVLLDDHLTFNLGDSFESFEAVKLRLEAHSSHSNVHYWKRDTRTVTGARKKTTRHIEPRLKYYGVKYACVYGGNKHFSKSSGKRNCLTLKSDCPAHVTLRANRAGERLDVVSVCNHHNHDVSPAVSQRTRQARRLGSPLKQEVLDLLRMGVLKRKVLDYVRWRSGQQLRYKDVINMAAAVKGSPPPSRHRSRELQQALYSLEAQSDCKDEVKNETEAAKDLTGKIKNRKRKLMENKTPSDVHEEDEHKDVKYSKLGVKEENVENLMNVDFNVKNETIQKYEEVDQIDNGHIEEHNSDNTHNRNIMEYLYTDCDRRSILTILNHKKITLDPDKTDEAHSVKIKPIKVVPTKQESLNSILNEEIKLSIENNRTKLNGNTLTLQNNVDKITVQLDDTVAIPGETQNIDTATINFVEKPVLTILNNEIDLTPFDPDDPEHYLNHVIIEDTSLLQDAEFEQSVNFVDLPEENNVTISEDVGGVAADDMQILKESEIIMEETWISGDSIDNRDNEKLENVNITDSNNDADAEDAGKCRNCEKIQFDLNVEVKSLRNEKKDLLEETQRLRKQRNYLLKEINNLKEASVQQNLTLPTGVKLLMKRNKLYLIQV